MKRNKQRPIPAPGAAPEAEAKPVSKPGPGGATEPPSDNAGEPLSQRAYAGPARGFGGGRYAAPYSGTYGGDLRNDYYAEGIKRESFRSETGEEKDRGDEMGSTYGGLKHDRKLDDKKG